MIRMAHNPAWERDELILALDLYFRVGAQVRSQDPEVISLSQVLRSLPLHQRVPVTEKFRSPDAVHLKLQNFLTVDPSYPGEGLSHGGQADRAIFREFKDNHQRLHQLARAIIHGAAEIGSMPSRYTEEDEEEFPEGRVLYRLHRLHERDPELVKRAKKRWISRSHGRPACQVCRFDFEEKYGTLGCEYIECHHNLPVSDLSPGGRTLLRDLTPVCANCHRMLHRKRPWVSVEELSEIVASTRAAQSRDCFDT